MESNVPTTKATDRCPGSGLSIGACKKTDLCDCFDYPELENYRMDERCDWSELYVDQCAHCLGHGDVPNLTDFDFTGMELRPNGVPQSVEFPSRVPDPRDE